jgi:PII-like signaling protein
MNGYQVTFFTQQNRTHAGLPVAEWLVREAKRMNLEGATMVTAAEGLGRDRKIHCARFFELGDQPVEVTLAMSEAHLPALLARLQEEKLNLFYIKIPIEYGFSCADPD